MEKEKERNGANVPYDVLANKQYVEQKGALLYVQRHPLHKEGEVLQTIHFLPLLRREVNSPLPFQIHTLQALDVRR